MSGAASQPVALRGFGWLGITAFAWGLNWPVMKALMADWPPYTVRIFAALAAVAMLLLIATIQRDRLMPRRDADRLSLPAPAR